MWHNESTGGFCYCAEYEYDALGRLVRENNKKLNETCIIRYDNKGNILNKSVYSYTLKKGDELEEMDCEILEYEYDSMGKLFQLGSYSIMPFDDGRSFRYKNNITMWNGKEMISYGEHTFTYDVVGRRVSKDNITYDYDVNGRLIRQSNGISYIYDHNSLIGFKYNNKTYFYRRDILGNIIAILDSVGAVVVEYIYDAWGNHTVTDYTSIGLGNINPYRYKGYYYDTEIGLYFLKTRFYDPQACRFISMDDIAYIDPETIGGVNLYAYCNNNPVMNVDPNGKFFFTFLAAVGIGALFGAVDGGITAVMSGQDFWTGFAAGAIGGAIGGAVSSIVGIFSPRFGIVLARGISSLTYDFANEFFQTGTWNVDNFGVYFAETSMDIAFSMLYTGYFANMKNNLIGNILSGFTDSVVDVIQTYLFLTPQAQKRIRNCG